MPVNAFPLLLVAHIALAISLFLPSILLPFALRTRRATVDSGSRVVRWLLWAQSQRHARHRRRAGAHGSRSRGGARTDDAQQPWLLLALAIYFVNLAIAFFVQRPNLRRLIGVKAAADDAIWKDRAKRQRYVSYLMAGAGRDDRVPDELQAGALVSEGGAVPADCLFCRIVAGEVPSTRVHEDDLVIAFRDIAPRAPTHILVIPRRHIASAADLTEADGPLLGRLFAVAAGSPETKGSPTAATGS